MCPVSILSRPEGRVQRLSAQIPMRDVAVSILTRPEGRVQPGEAIDGWELAEYVSILTRPEGRVQR